MRRRLRGRRSASHRLARSMGFARPKSSTLTVPSSRTLMFAGFRSRWMMPARARFERLGDLPRDRQRLVQRHGPRASRSARVLALDQLHDQRAHAAASSRP